MSRLRISTNESVRSSMLSMPARPPRSSTARRCFNRGVGSFTRVTVLHGSPDLDLVGAAVDFLHVHPHVFAGLGREVLADVIGADRKLAVPAVDQDRELHGA